MDAASLPSASSFKVNVLSSGDDEWKGPLPCIMPPLPRSEAISRAGDWRTRMKDNNLMLLSDAQQRIYVDAIFAMAALDGFEIVCTTDGSAGRPIMCAKQMGKYRVEICWIDEHEYGADATKATWEIEVNEGDAGGWKVPLVHVALHATDALRIAKGLVRFYDVLTHPSHA